MPRQNLSATANTSGASASAWATPAASAALGTASEVLRGTYDFIEGHWQNVGRNRRSRERPVDLVPQFPRGSPRLEICPLRHFLVWVDFRLRCGGRVRRESVYAHGPVTR